MQYPVTAGIRPASFFLVLTIAVSAKAATITVDTMDDEFDTTSNATCSLREAIESSNGDADFGGCTADGVYSDDTILLPAGTYSLTRTPAEAFLDVDNAVGDLDITSNTRILGDTRDTTIIERPGDASDNYGVIYSGFLATISLENLTIRGGQTVAGAGIFADFELSLERVAVRDNLARAVDAGGGGIVVFGALNLIDSVITDNRVELIEPCDVGPETTGGGVLAFLDARSLIQRTTISNNTVGGPPDCRGFGGGLGALPGFAPLRIVNSTISGNSAPLGGGADLFFQGFSIGQASEPATGRNRSRAGDRGDTSRWFDRQMPEGENRGSAAGASLEHVTITDNSADEIGGLSMLDIEEAGTARIENSLIAGNSAALAPDCSRFGVTVDDAGISLLGVDEFLDGDAACLSSPNLVGNAGAPVNPGLMPLADNGGLTPTHALPSGSPALDAAPDTGEAEDQRGVERPEGTDFDIGAFEAIQTDVSVTQAASGLPAVPGTTISYEITVSNLGPSDDPAVMLVDSFPPQLGNCSYTSTATDGASGNTPSGTGDLAETIDMPAGSSVTYSITCDIDPGATGQLTNTADAKASHVDDDVTNDTASVAITLQPTADLSVFKSDNTTSTVPGTSNAYSITIANAGPSDDPAVTLTDNLPAGLTGCTWSSTASDGATGNTAPGNGDLSEILNMPAGSSIDYVVDCGIDPAATGTLTNTAEAGSSVNDPETGNNAASDSTTLQPQADIAITKTDDAATIKPGGTISYRIVVSNFGPSDDPAVTITDEFPAELATCTYTSSATGGAAGNSTSGNGDLAETVSLPAGSSVRYDAICSVPESISSRSVSNTASAAASVFDANGSNNSATAGDTQVLLPVPSLDRSAVIVLALLLLLAPLLLRRMT